MTYAIDGRQYVVIAAGGHGGAGTTRGTPRLRHSLLLERDFLAHEATAKIAQFLSVNVRLRCLVNTTL